VLADPGLVSRRSAAARDALHDRALAAALHAQDPIAEALVRWRRGVQHRRSSRPDQAITELERALELAAGNPWLEAHCEFWLGRLASASGGLDAARQHLERARDGFEASGDRAGEGWARLDLRRGNEDPGELTRITVLFRGAGCRTGLARLHLLLAAELRDSAEPEGALAELAAAEEQLRPLAGSLMSMTVLAEKQGVILVELGLLDEARDRLEESLALATRLGLGGELDLADRRLHALLNRFPEGTAYDRGWVYERLAEIDVERGDADGASRHIAGAVGTRATTDAVRGMVHALNGQFEDAEKAFDRAEQRVSRLERRALAIQRGVLPAARAIAAVEVAGAADKLLVAARQCLDPDGRDAGVRVAQRILLAALARAEKTGDTLAAERSHALVIDAGARRFRVPGGEWVDITGRTAMRRIVETLANLRATDASATLDMEELFAAGWPGERVRRTSARSRVYVAISTLRRLGLEQLVRAETGYQLDPGVPVVMLREDQELS
jgi:tetratricopeptide (TPR) repeat protein